MGNSCKNFEYLQFDDTYFVIGGVVLTAIAFPLLYMGIPVEHYLETPFFHFFESILYVGSLWMLLRYALIFFRKKFPRISQTLKRNLYLAAVGFIITYVVCICSGAILSCIFDNFHMQRTVEKFEFIYVTYAYLVALSIFAVYEAIYYAGKYKTVVAERERLKTAQVQTELENLRNQINPHFLFNSLNTLMNLIPKDPDRAMSYLGKLSKFYRYSVNKKDGTTVSLATEVKNAKIYADLLHERFGDNIEIEFKGHIPEQAQIFPMTLQLLIENAVKHNIVSKSKPLLIELFADLNGEYIYVRNNLQVKIQAVNSTGMGLRNIKERFSYLTDKKVTVDDSDGYFEIGIPLIQSQVLA